MYINIYFDEVTVTYLLLALSPKSYNLFCSGTSMTD